MVEQPSETTKPSTEQYLGDLISGTYCSRIFSDCDRKKCRLQSPNFPGLYPRNLTCYYAVSLHSKDLHFKNFRIILLNAISRRITTQHFSLFVFLLLRVRELLSKSCFLPVDKTWQKFDDPVSFILYRETIKNFSIFKEWSFLERWRFLKNSKISVLLFF